jgi:hypothetical protein
MHEGVRNTLASAPAPERLAASVAPAAPIAPASAGSTARWLDAAPGPRSSRIWLSLAIVGALAISAFEALQASFIVPRIGWPLLFLYELPVWFCWVLLFPPIFAIARRWPLADARWRRHVPIHIVASLIAPVLLLTGAALARAGLAWLILHSTVALSPDQLHYVRATADLSRMVPYTLTRYFAFPILLYYAVVALHHAMAYYRAFNERRLREAELEALLVRSQLDSLKLQLQPHFLFNTLNTASSLVSHDPMAARVVLTRLSDLLRYALRDRGEHEATLAEDLAFLQGYLEIQRARFRENLEVELSIASETLSMLVPRILLQPLVENAIHHGFPDEGPARITVSAELRRGELVLMVADNGKGFGGERPTGTGIGLRNTEDRLERLYRGAARLELSNGPAGGARVTVIVPVRDATRRGEDRDHARSAPAL